LSVFHRKARPAPLPSAIPKWMLPLCSYYHLTFAHDDKNVDQCFAWRCQKVGRFDSGSSRPCRLWHTVRLLPAGFGIIDNNILLAVFHNQSPTTVFSHSMTGSGDQSVLPSI
jgi:hypothetical protein